MRIGIDARVLQGERRGQWRYAYCLIDALLRGDRSNTYVLFYNGFRRGAFAFAPRPNLEQRWCRFPGSALTPLWEGAGWPPVDALIPGRVDVFHNLLNYNRVFHTPLPSRCPMVATYHGIPSPQVLEESFGYTPGETRAWIARLVERTDRVIAISGLVRRNLEEYAPGSAGKVRIVYSGVEERFRPARPEETASVLSRYGLEREKYFLYAGGMERNKNLEAFVSGAARLSRPDIRCVLAGPAAGPLKAGLSAAYPGGVVFPGYVPDTDLIALYTGCLAFVLPTIYEGFGLPVLEAMACGAPVVASRATGVLERVGDAVLQFDPSESGALYGCLRRLAEDGAFRQGLSARGPEAAGRLRWEKTAADTVAVYEECLS